MMTSSSTSASDKPSRRPGLARSAIRAAAAILLVAVVLVGGAVAALLWTEPGRQQLIRIVEMRLSSADQGVLIGTLDGSLPQTIRLGDVRFYDPMGDWLTVGALEVDWRPQALWSGRIDVQRIDLFEPRLHRLPDGGAAEPDPDPLSGLRTAGALRVETLRVEGGWLGPAVLGEAISFRAASDVTTAGDGIWQGRLRVERTDGVAAKAEIDARFDAVLKRLRISGAFSEPEGGAAARAVGLPGLPAVSISIDGDGPLDTWQGSILAEAESLAQLQSDIVVEREQTSGAYIFSAAGRSGIAESLPDELAALQLADLRFDLRVLWDGGDTLSIRRARLTTAVAEAEGVGTVDLTAAALDVNITVQTDRLDISAQDLQIGPATAEITAAGSWFAPDVSLVLALGQSRVSEMAFTSAELAARITPQVGAPSIYATTFDGRLVGPDFPEPGPALIGDVLTFDGAGSFGPDLIQVTTMRAAGNQLRLEAIGSFDFGSGAIETSLDVDLDALDALAGFLPITPSGSASAEGFFQRPGPDSPITGTAAVTIATLGLGSPSFDQFLGDEVVVAAEFLMRPADGISFDAVDIASGPIRLAASGSLDGGWSTLDGKFQVDFSDLAGLSSLAGLPVSGSLTGRGTLQGAAADPTVDVVVESTTLALNGLRFESVAGRLELAHLTSRPNGRARLNVAGPIGPLAFSADVLRANDRLSLRRVIASASDTSVTGTAEIALSTGRASGTLTGRIPDIQQWAALAGLEATGAVDFDLVASERDGAQVVELDLRAADINAADVGVSFDQGTVTGVATMTPAGPRADAALRLSRIYAGNELALDGATLTLGGSTEAMDVTLAASGPYADGLDLRAKGLVEYEAPRLRATLAQLAGTAGDTEFALTGPTEAVLTAGRIALATTAMSIGSGRVSFAADLAEQSLDGELAIDALPLSVLRAFAPTVDLSGRLSGRARLTGSRMRPEAELELTLVDVVSAAVPVETVPPGTGTAQATLRDGRLRAGGSFVSVGEPLTFEADLPVQMPAVGWQPFVPSDGSLSANIAWQGDIALPWELLPLPDHRLSGPTQVELGVSGSLSTPRVEAALQMSGAEYENLETGTLLTALDVSIRSADSRTARIRLSAQDGGDGLVTGNGVISFEQLRTPRIDLTTSLQNVTFLRRDEVTAAASGSLVLAGTPSDTLLSGQVNLSPAEIRLIGNALPPSVIDLPVIEVDGSLIVLPASGPQDVAGAVELAIQVAIPGRVFVRGRGLDSEWGGNLQISGTTAQPIITGQLAALRGDFSFAGRSFDLRDSSISFDGAEEIDPQLDIVAANAEPDLTAIIRVSGRASDPVIGLDSIPPLPEDEIVSRVLFGKGVGSLTALEAVQLGAAVASLTGAGGSANVLDRVRERLGVDRLSVDAGENGAAVSAGRYVGDRAFVGVRQGTAPGTSAATVELEVAPNITVESELNSVGAPKTGIFWKRDY